MHSSSKEWSITSKKLAQKAVIAKARKADKVRADCVLVGYALGE